MNVASPITVTEGILGVDGVLFPELATQFGTPLYVYSRNCIEQRLKKLVELLQVRPEHICYSVKANSNLTILQIFARLGTGFDVVSGIELHRVIEAGAGLDRVVFSGVGKTKDEIRTAVLAGIRFISVESLAELDVIATIACAEQRVTPVSIRINPDIDVDTHPHITTGLECNKFGLDIQTAMLAYQRIATNPWLKAVAINCHLGSQIKSPKPYVDACKFTLNLVTKLARLGLDIQYLDLGGGFGIASGASEVDLNIADLNRQLRLTGIANNLQLIFEPGRYLVGPAGFLLSRVIYTKPSKGWHFTIVDAAMNDFIRPAMYAAEHEILPVKEAYIKPDDDFRTDVVGAVCESGDFLAKNQCLRVQPGDLVILCDAGAYGYVMASNYNSRLRPAEVLITGEHRQLIRERESMEYMLQLEKRLLSAS